MHAVVAMLIVKLQSWQVVAYRGQHLLFMQISISNDLQDRSVSFN